MSRSPRHTAPSRTRRIVGTAAVGAVAAPMAMLAFGGTANAADLDEGYVDTYATASDVALPELPTLPDVSVPELPDLPDVVSVADLTSLPVALPALPTEADTLPAGELPSTDDFSTDSLPELPALPVALPSADSLPELPLDVPALPLDSSALPELPELPALPVELPDVPVSDVTGALPEVPVVSDTVASVVDVDDILDGIL